MRISSFSEFVNSLPTARNFVNKNAGTLKQITTSEELFSYCSPSGNWAGSCVEFTQPDVPGKDYTVQHALERQWYAQGEVTLNFDEPVKKQIKIIPPPTKADLDALQKKLRSDGLKPGIDLPELEGSFSDLDDEFNSSSFAPEKLGTDLDYITSRYAYLKSRLASDADSEDAGKLDELYQSTLDRMATDYAKTVGDFLDDTGVHGEGQKLYNSILAQANAQVGRYSDYLSRYPDYAGLNGSPDQWLSSDDAYMAARLRDAARMDSTVPVSGSSYSINDIELVGKYAQQMSQQIMSLSSNSNVPDEESVGLDCASLAMKIDVFTQKSGMGNDMSAIIKTSFGGYLQNYLDKQGDVLQTTPRLLPGDERGFSPFQKDQALAVYQQTMTAYQEKGNALQAIIAGADYGQKVFNQKCESAEYSGIYRYSLFKTSNWDNSYSAPDAKTGYEDSSSTFQKYAANWASFTDSLNSGKIGDVDFYLGNWGQLSIARDTQKSDPPFIMNLIG
jgi:hypothetical protein